MYFKLLKSHKSVCVVNMTFFHYDSRVVHHYDSRVVHCDNSNDFEICLRDGKFTPYIKPLV